MLIMLMCILMYSHAKVNSTTQVFTLVGLFTSLNVESLFSVVILSVY
jgi:hypothetical protein